MTETLAPPRTTPGERPVADGALYRLEKRLLNATGRAVRDFDLICEGDRVLVGVSGGKDSLVLLCLLDKLRRRAPVKFSIAAINIDLGQPGFDPAPVRAFVESLGVEGHFIAQDVYSVARAKAEPGKSLCPICSRLRRGILYTQAIALGCNKIALGHHREDLIETLLLSAFYAGALKSMPPLLRADDGKNTVIRPLVYCAEEEIIAYARALALPVAPPPPCETEDLQRARVKNLVRDLAKDHPAVPGNLLNALRQVVPTHLLDPTIRSTRDETRLSSKK